MFEEQLDFSKPKTDDQDDNYFIYNRQEPNEDDFKVNYFSDLQEAKINTQIGYIKKPSLTNEEQLQYKLQPNINIFPEEKPNPLFYNARLERQTKKSKTKNLMKKRNKSSTNLKFRPFRQSIPTSNIRTAKRQRPTSNKQKNKLYITNSNKKEKDFNFSNNNTGLFDPSLKKNMLEGTSHYQKQKINSMKKILDYNEKFGKKVDNLQIYNNYLYALNKLENNKISDEYEREQAIIDQKNKIKLKNRDKFSKEAKEELFKKLIGMPKPHVNYKNTNLDFNFDKYEDIITSLKNQIDNEIKLRKEADKKYLQKLKECEDLNLNKMVKKLNPTSNKMSKSVQLTAQSNIKKTEISKKSGVSNKNKNSTYIQKVQNNLNKTPQQILMENNDRIVKATKKVINKDYKDFQNKLEINKHQLVSKNLYQNKTTQKEQTNTRPISNTQISQTQPLTPKIILTNNNMSHYPKNPSLLNYNVNKELISGLSNENKILNDILKEENNKRLDNLNKCQLIAAINNSVAQYSKLLPQMINKVTDAMDKIQTLNIVDETTHPIIKLASKTSGRIIHENIEEIINLIIDDLLLESVNDLQMIEESNNKLQKQKDLISYVSTYLNNIEETKKMESQVYEKINNNASLVNPAISYMSVSKMNNLYKMYNTDNNMKSSSTQMMQSMQPMSLNPFDENMAMMQTGKSNKIFDMYAGNMPGVVGESYYSACVNNELVQSVEKYAKEFKDHLLLKGTFYYDNIFGIYEQIAKECVNEIIDDEVKEMNNNAEEFVKSIYKDEINNMNKDNNNNKQSHYEEEDDNDYNDFNNLDG